MIRVAHIILYLLPAFFSSCQKEIEVELPALKSKIVVDGRIEQGVPPYIILTHNKAYFGNPDLNKIEFVHNAIINVTNGTSTVMLTEYCSESLPDSLLPFIAGFTGIDTLLLKNFNYCVYSTFNPVIYGQTGKTYSLTIVAEGKTYTASTSILSPVPLDSLWWRVDKDDTLGSIWSHLTEPPEEGNAYRWLAKKIGRDYTFLPPFNSAFNDKFINGQSFDFAYGYYNKGDTIAVKFCALDNAVYDFFRSLEIVINNEGNPFASPSSVRSNIYPQEEALGIWAGYGTALDTIVCK